MVVFDIIKKEMNRYFGHLVINDEPDFEDLLKRLIVIEPKNRMN